MKTPKPERKKRKAEFLRLCKIRDVHAVLYVVDLMTPKLDELLQRFSPDGN